MLVWLVVVSGMVACFPAHAQATIHSTSQRIERTASLRHIELPQQVDTTSPTLSSNHALSFDSLVSITLVAIAPIQGWHRIALLAPTETLHPISRVSSDLRIYPIRGPPIA